MDDEERKKGTNKSKSDDLERLERARTDREMRMKREEEDRRHAPSKSSVFQATNVRVKTLPENGGKKTSPLQEARGNIEVKKTSPLQEARISSGTKSAFPVATSEKKPDNIDNVLLETKSANARAEGEKGKVEIEKIKHTPLNVSDKPVAKAFERVKALSKIKHFEVFVAVAFVVVLMIVYFSSFSSCESAKKDLNKDVNAFDYCNEIENKLKSTLSKVKGAGEVELVIHFESSEEIIIAYLKTQSKTSSPSGSASKNESAQGSENPIVLTQNGSQLPLILKTVYPKILGVLVVAKGADNITLKLQLLIAVQTLLDVDPKKIQILTMA